MKSWTYHVYGDTIAGGCGGVSNHSHRISNAKVMFTMPLIRTFKAFLGCRATQQHALRHFQKGRPDRANVGALLAITK
jgi:hypothetical protein